MSEAQANHLALEAQRDAAIQFGRHMHRQHGVSPKQLWNTQIMTLGSTPGINTRYQPVLEAFCHANLARREDAWEVLQQTNLKIWEKSADWNPDTGFLPWAFAVARFTMQPSEINACSIVPPLILDDGRKRRRA